MRRLSRKPYSLGIAAAALMLSAARPAQALMLVVTSPNDTTHLTVGQTITVDVGVESLSPGQDLTELSATAFYDSTVFSSAVSLAPGAIVPSPLFSPTDFQTSTGTGTATGTFDTLGTTTADQITTNGVFFSFQLQVIGAGSGIININPATLTAGLYNSDDVSHATALSAQVCDNLSFNATTSVPEPHTWLSGLLAVVAGGLFMVSRVRRMKTVRAD
jgi:hypothetical protein